MSDGEQRGGPGGSEERPVVYCLIPPELAPKLHELLRRHFRDDPSVEVVVERRHRERRSGKERRDRQAAPPQGGERRRVRSEPGRRAGERRAALVPVDRPPELPRRARRYAARIAFVERLEPSAQQAEDADTARLVARIQSGEGDTYTDLYRRYFDRVYGYLRLLLRDPHDAEDGTQDVFLRVLEALPRYERRRQPFRAWLFTIVRNAAIDRITERNHMELLEEVEAQRPERAVADEEQELATLDWLSDPDLTLLVERLPLLQRQILLLRYTFDLDYRQIGAILDRTADNVRAQNYRALKFLRARLASLGRGFGQGTRARMQRGRRKANVLRARRYALDP